MLLYNYDKSEVRKNKVIYIIKLEYIFLLQNFDFIITALMDIIINNIDGSIIHINFFISVKNRYKKLNTIFDL